MPARRPTEDESEERFEFVYDLLAAGRRKSAIKRAYREKFGPLSARQIEAVLSRARARVLLELREEKEWHRAAALGVFASVVANPAEETRDRLAAQAHIVKLLALDVRLPANLKALLDALNIEQE